MPENITQKPHVTPTTTQMDTIKSSLTAVALKKRGYTAKDLLQHYQTHGTGHEQLSPHFMLWLAGYSEQELGLDCDNWVDKLKPINKHYWRDYLEKFVLKNQYPNIDYNEDDTNEKKWMKQNILAVGHNEVKARAILKLDPWDLVNNYKCCTRDLKQAGYSASALYKYCRFRASRGLSIFSINDLKQAGYPDQEIVTAVLEEKRRQPAFIQAEADELRQFFTISYLKQSGFTPFMILSACYLPSKIQREFQENQQENLMWATDYLKFTHPEEKDFMHNFWENHIGNNPFNIFNTGNKHINSDMILNHAMEKPNSKTATTIRAWADRQLKA